MPDFDFEQSVDGMYHWMDPETEDLLVNGKKLQNGMVVQIETEKFRSSINGLVWQKATESTRARILRWNTWCKVTELEICDHAVSFVGVYQNGQKAKLVVPLRCAWYVKKDSIPSVEDNFVPCPADVTDDELDQNIPS